MDVHFGKYKGQTVQEIWDAEPSYVAWIVSRRNSASIDTALAQYIIREFFGIPYHCNENTVAMSHAIHAVAHMNAMMHHSGAKPSIEQQHAITKAQCLILNSLNGEHSVMDMPTVGSAR